MKKLRPLFCAAVFVLLSLPVTAQTPITYKSSHYELTADAGTESDLASFANELEMRFAAYNSTFRFVPIAQEAALKVRVFTDPASYDAYVNARLGYSANSAVYLHYNNIERRELVVLKGSPELDAILSHQAFVQFLRAYIPNPPTWMLQGFSVYYSRLKYDPVLQHIDYERDLPWLEPIRNLGNDILYPGQILMADLTADIQAAAGSDQSNSLQICSPAFASFLMYNPTHFRTLSNSFQYLSPANSAKENSQAIMDYFSLWTDFDMMNSEYTAFIDISKTFAEYMADGRRYYDAGDNLSAYISFMMAQVLRPDHYAPYYYMGLFYYEEQNYDAAERDYLQSLERGADEALVSYALGVNAASAGRSDDARTWLTKAAALDPARYQTKAEDLISKLR